MGGYILVVDDDADLVEALDLELSGRGYTVKTALNGAEALMQVRQEIADFLSALITVYTICIVAWIVASFVFSLGGRVPYNRVLSAVLDFLRDVSEPYLRIFRRLPLQFGPIDFSPIVAIIVLRIVGGLVVSLIAP